MDRILELRNHRANPSFCVVHQLTRVGVERLNLLIGIALHAGFRFGHARVDVVAHVHDGVLNVGDKLALGALKIRFAVRHHVLHLLHTLLGCGLDRMRPIVARARQVLYRSSCLLIELSRRMVPRIAQGMDRRGHVAGDVARGRCNARLKGMQHLRSRGGDGVGRMLTSLVKVSSVLARRVL